MHTDDVVEFSALRTLEPVEAARQPVVRLKGQARDIFVSTLWGYPMWGAENPAVLEGVYGRPGLETAGVVGHAFGRWWVRK